MAANGGVRAPRVVTRWSTRSIRNAPGLGDPQVLSVPVGNRVSLGVGSDGLAVQGSAFSPGSREARRAAELDQRLDHMTRRPINFAAEFSRFSVAEQEIWLPALAERAHEASRGGDALEALRLAGDRQAERLATAFLAELRQVRDRPEVAALQQGDASFHQGAAALQEGGDASQR
jgi:hypothetical protein